MIKKKQAQKGKKGGKTKNREEDDTPRKGHNRGDRKKLEWLTNP